MTLIALTVGLVALAVVTLIGTRLIDRANPPSGRFVDVDGGRLHVVELGAPDAPPVLLLHGASGNLRDLKLALGDTLARRYRVILIDRPGHGWSDRPAGKADASPARQTVLIRQAVAHLGVKRPIVLGQSWSGALAAAYALAYPRDVRAVVLLAPVTHPWPGGIGWINAVVATPIIGRLIAHTLIMPAGYRMFHPALRTVFWPQTPPQDYAARTGGFMVLRPSEFIANAQDLAGLKEFVRAQAPRYGEIGAPVAIVAGDPDPVVHTDIHSVAFVEQLPHATLAVLPGVGHMVQYAAPDRVLEAIDAVAKSADEAIAAQTIPGPVPGPIPGQ